MQNLKWSDKDQSEPDLQSILNKASNLHQPKPKNKIWQGIKKAIYGVVVFLIVLFVGGLSGRIVTLVRTGKAAEIVDRITKGSKPEESSLKKEIEAALYKAANEVNQECPIMIDETTRLDRMTIEPGLRNVYYYTIVPISSGDHSNEELRQFRLLLQQEVLDTVCKNPKMKNALSFGAAYVYHYFSYDDVKLFTIEADGKSCGYEIIDID